MKDKEICGVSWCSWIAIISWLVIGITAVFLYIFCLDLYKRKTAPKVYQNPVFQSASPNKVEIPPQVVPEKPAVQAAKTESTLKVDLQAIAIDIEKEMKSRISELEDSNKKMLLIVSDLTDKSNELSSRINITGSKVEALEQDVELRDKKTNERIDVLVRQFKEITERIMAIQVQVDANTANIKDLSEKLEAQRKVIAEQRKMIEENKQQISDMKLMFVNYDTVLAIEKAKKKNP